MTIQNLAQIFEEHRDIEKKTKQEKYLKDQFKFLGIPKPMRSELEKEFLQEWKKDQVTENLKRIENLHNYGAREYMYTAQQLALKIYKSLEYNDIIFLSELTRTNSWWENTDGYGSVIKRWLKNNPEFIESYVEYYSLDPDFWLRRLSIIAQLSLKEDTNFQALKKAIINNLGSEEFFINKAIGWALRDYAKTYPQETIDFVRKYDSKLSNLSKREALKGLNNGN